MPLDRYESDIVREALLQRIDAARPRIIAAIAPAGYGKSTLVRQLARRIGPPTICDCLDLKGPTDFARRLATALAIGDAERSPKLASQHLVPSKEADWSSFALDSWCASSEKELVIFENAEHVASSAPCIGFLSRLLARTPEGRKVAICARRPLPLSLTRFFPPHQVLTLRAQELRFDQNEIQQVFASGELSNATVRRIESITRGWPIAVFLIDRLARESNLERALDSAGDVAFNDLYDYLSEQVLTSMSAMRFASLLAVSALTHASEDEVRAALAADHEELASVAASSPFLYAIGPDRYECHPLLRAMLLERYADRCAAIRLQAAHGLKKSDVLRAAQLYVEVGRAEAAAELLEGAHEFLMRDIPPLFAEVVARLEADTLVRHPAVWQAATLVRITGMPHDQWLREGLAVRERLTPNAPVSVKIGVLSSLGNALTNLGRHDEAWRIFEGIARDYPELAQARAVVGGFCAMIEARRGRFSRAMELWNEAAHLFAESSLTRALGIVQIESLALRYGGEREAERSRLETGVALAETSGSPLALALALEESAFAAWFAGEDVLFAQYAGLLEATATPSIGAATEVFRSGAKGDIESLRAGRGVEHPKIRFYASLMLCASTSGEERAECAQRSLAAAIEAAEPMSAAIACIVCAECDPAVRDEYVQRARRYASTVESLPLRRAIDGYGPRAIDSGMLAPLLGRLRQMPGGRMRPLESPYQLSLVTQSLRRGGERVAIAPRETELLAFLGARNRPCRPEEIAEALWPREPGTNAPSVRVYINRIRKRCNDRTLIIAERGSYRLGEGIRVDLVAIERSVASARRAGGRLSPEDRSELSHYLGHLNEPPSSIADDWDWYASVRARADDLRREIGSMLAQDAIVAGDFQAALGYARSVLDADACDEPARELMIRAYFAAGDRSSALREFRVYRDTLATELGAAPSQSLERLVTGIDGSEPQEPARALA
jgi:DNA-binding SARP family transcriptional activator/tetratricopeptide (TPR) repeat protein